MSINSIIAKQFADPKGLGGSLVSLVMNRQNRPLYDETIRLLSLADSDSVLDIGCGNGYVLRLLARRYNATFAGIDPSKEIIEAARRRNRSDVKNGKMRFACQDVSSMSFPDEAFSKAYTINTLYTNEALSRFSHTQFGYRRYEPKQLVDAGTEAGFGVEAVPILGGMAVCYLYTKAADGVI